MEQLSITDGNNGNEEESADLRPSAAIDLDLQIKRKDTITLMDDKLMCWDKIYVFYKSIDYMDWKKVYVAQLLEGGYVTGWMTILTIWALYAEDFKIALTDVDSDEAFSWIAFVAFIFFLLEWLLASWSTENYMFSFFFWLDFIATISLIPDIIFMSEALGLSTSGDGADPSSARAGRAARAGTRAGRIVRIVRLVRIGKLSKQFFAWWDKRNEEESDEAKSDEEAKEYEDEAKPSNLGTHLSQLITKRVIIGVLTMIFVVPFLQPSQSEKAFHFEDAVTILNDMYGFQLNGDISSNQFDTYLGWFKEDYTSGETTLDKRLIYLQINSNTPIVNDESTISKLRVTETEAFNVGNIKAMLSVEAIKEVDAWKSIGLTTFLIFMLTILAVVFNNDTQRYVIKPINQMVDSVKLLIENPMLVDTNVDHDGHQFETAMLQGTIGRIGKLLQLGFGQAGSEIIKASLSSNLAANVGGRHMNAIFGFCDIRNFTDATECLQAEIMNFVNEVADVVHCSVVDHGGAPNKNVGDAFLLVWTLPDDCILSEDINNGGFKQDNNSDIISKVQMLGDSALISLIKIIISINNKNKGDFRKYIENENIIGRFGTEWEVRLGWGLHTGWAIEGAIGSRFKIDASYLSPNVNLAEDLEGATKFYGVPFLVSEHMINILSPFAKSICRQIDRVHIAGIEQPFNLYCVDIWQTHKDKLSKIGFKTKEPFVGCFKVKKKFTKSERKFASDDELKRIHEKIPIQHKQCWDVALKLYLNGKWLEAKKEMENVLKILPTDGPCQAILNYMKKHRFKCPADWQGYREHD